MANKASKQKKRNKMIAIGIVVVLVATSMTAILGMIASML